MIFLLFGFYTASSSSSSSRFWYNALSSRFWRIVSNYISFLSCSVIYTLLSSSWLSNPSSSSSLLSAFFRRFSFISSSIIFILRSRIESKSVLSAWANRANRLSYSNSFDWRLWNTSFSVNFFGFLSKRSFSSTSISNSFLFFFSFLDFFSGFYPIHRTREWSIYLLPQSCYILICLNTCSFFIFHLRRNSWFVTISRDLGW